MAEPFFEERELPTGLQGNVEIPTLGTLDGDTIHCVYSKDINSIRIQSTHDGGRTWTESVEVMALPGPRYITDANILVDRHRLTVFATHVQQLPQYEDRFAKTRFLASVSEDGGATWSEPEALPIERNYVVGCIHAPVWLDGDDVVMGYSCDVPAEEEKPAASEGGMYLKSGVLISHDRGRTWSAGADVEVDHHPIGADEPAVVRLSDGELFAVLRTSHPMPYETRSHDAGLTWDPPEPSGFRGHNSPTALLRLGDGSVVRAWDNSPTNRFPLVVSLSEDDCATWTPPHTVAEPEPLPDGSLSFRTACYPSLAQAADGTVLMAWWQRTEAGVNSVRLARFNREWIEETRAWPEPRKIVAFGDSVTRGVRPGVTEYHTFRHLLQKRLAAEGTAVTVINAGVGSDTTDRAMARFERDVLAQEPALTMIMFGLNDAAMVDPGPVARTEPRVALDRYVANLRTFISRLREAGSEVLLCAPNPMTRAYPYQHLGAYAENEDMNFMLRGYAEAVRELAAEMDVELVDAFRLFSEEPERLELLEDGVHPYVEGHRLIADAMIDAVRRMLAPTQ